MKNITEHTKLCNSTRRQTITIIAANLKCHCFIVFYSDENSQRYFRGNVLFELQLLFHFQGYPDPDINQSRKDNKCSANVCVKDEMALLEWKWIVIRSSGCHRGLFKVDAVNVTCLFKYAAIFTQTKEV